MHHDAWIMWIILLLICGHFVHELRAIKKDRRLGRVTSNGHPIRDFVLLFVSALILISVLGIVLFLGNSRLGEETMHAVPIHYALVLLVAMVAIVLTALSNRLLGKYRKRKSHNQ